MKRFKQTPVGICIHHSATADGVKHDAEAIRRFHKSHAHNGVIISADEYASLKAAKASGLKAPWEDIGYHYLVERIDGVAQIIEGRSVQFQGAHCPELNGTHLGICLVGNYDLAAPDNELLEVLQRLCDGLMHEFRIPLRGIAYHCDHSTKTCPGKHFPKTGFLLALAGEERP